MAHITCPRCQGSGHISGPKTLGERLVAIREGRGLSQVEVETATGLSHATLWRMEKSANVNGGSIETLIKLADYYRVSLDDLFGRADNT
jgi:transcriptional regulator with XRE-family HTH domain